MKTITLKKLTLRNFKRIRDLEVIPGKNTKILGMNATGKTTIYDAFCWLLFGKDSQGRADFEIKTIDPLTGDVMHGLEHEVEAVLDVDGAELTLTKIYQEKWTRKRGSTKAEFTGHTTQHFTNTMPVSESEFKAVVAKVCSEKTFRVLTSPHAFNDEKQFPWTERRKMLLEIGNANLTTADIIAADAGLSGLPGILGTRTVEDHKKVVKQSQSKINEKMKQLPVRIDENRRAMPDIDGIDEAKENTLLAAVSAKLSVARDALIRVENGGAIIERKNALALVNSELLELITKLQGNTQQEITKNHAARGAATTRLGDLGAKIHRVESGIRAHSAEIAACIAKREVLRSEWFVVSGRTYAPPDVSTTCPTCGQNIPENQIQDAHEKALGAFMADRASALERISRDGMAAKADQEKLENEVLGMQAEIMSLTDRERAEKETISAIDETIGSLLEMKNAYQGNAIYNDMLVQRTQIEADIKLLESGQDADTAPIKATLATLEAAKTAIEGRLKKLTDSADLKKRIGDLMAEETLLANQFERLENELFLCDLFEKTEARLLEGQINAKFQMARFRLFSQNINGGIEPTCQTMYEGVEWNRGLNTGHKINVGRDIINVLAEHYGVCLPCFADNSESVTELLPSVAQTIMIIHDPNCRQLMIKEE